VPCYGDRVVLTPCQEAEGVERHLKLGGRADESGADALLLVHPLKLDSQQVALRVGLQKERTSIDSYWYVS
jgi:hypothetical protein